MYRVKRLLCLAVLVGCTGDGPTEPTRPDCARLRDHIADMRFRSDPDAAHREALKQALGDDFVTKCVAEITPDELACAMRSTSVDALRSCTDHR